MRRDLETMRRKIEGLDFCKSVFFVPVLKLPSIELNCETESFCELWLQTRRTLSEHECKVLVFAAGFGLNCS